MRVVSLIASGTEIACALGFGDRLVGRSHACDFPEPVRRLPAVTSARVNASTSSRSIDEQVKKLLAQGGSAHQLDAQRLKELKPDVVLAQTRPDCGASVKDVEAALAGCPGLEPKVVALEPSTLADVWNDIRKVADALEAPPEGEALIHRLKARMQAVASAAASLPPVGVVCLEWLDPLLGAGNWLPELVAMAGGRSLFGEAGRPCGALTQGQLVQADPDVIVAAPCGFELRRTRLETQALFMAPGWSGLKAVRQGRAYAVDGDQFFNRPGPRLADSLEILAELLHPKEFSFGSRGKAWDRVA